MVAITSLHIENFGRFSGAHTWPEHGGLNLLVGENDTGKTQLLKLLYLATRTAEEYWRKHAGPQPARFEDLLVDKLLWTFLPGGSDFALGKLVHRSQRETHLRLKWNGGYLDAAWGIRAKKRLARVDVSGLEELQGLAATFLPAKEILSLFEAIRETRERTELAAFDDTYFDLFRDFQQSIPRGRLQDSIYDAMQVLGQATGGGEIELDEQGRLWWRYGDSRLAISQTAEGIRKAGILSRLMRNRRIHPARGGFLFVDEPEAHLHPKAEVLLADLLFGLAQTNIQVYVATHSYFVVKRLEQRAREASADHRLVSLSVRPDRSIELETSLLRHGLPPDNPILAQAVALFERDVELDFGEKD